MKWSFQCFFMKETFTHKISMPLRQAVASVFFCSFFYTGISQSVQTEDSSRVAQLNNSSKKYWMKNLDSSIYYAQKALQLSETLNYKKGIAESYRNMGVANTYMGDKNVSKQFLLKALTLFSLLADKNGIDRKSVV